LARDHYSVDTRAITFELLDAAADVRRLTLDIRSPRCRPMLRVDYRTPYRLKPSTRKTLIEMGLPGSR
jgi:hypothetical protein